MCSACARVTGWQCRACGEVRLNASFPPPFSSSADMNFVSALYRWQS